MHIKFFKSFFRAAPSANHPIKPQDGVLSQQELRRLVAEMVG